MFLTQSNPMLLRDRRNKELRSCCKQARAIINDNVHGMIIVDSAHAIQYANPAAERMLGSGQHLLDMPFPFTKHPGKAGEMTIMTKDRGPVSIEFWGMETEWNQKPAWLVTLQDVTERRKNEQELRKMYRAVLESPVMVVITDAAGTIEFVNPKFSEITGYSFAEITGANLYEQKLLGCPDIYTQIWDTVNNGTEWHGEVEGCRKNGETFHESMSIAPIQDGGGTITNWVAVIEDVTDRRRYEEQLRNSEQQLAEAQKIAHLGSWKRYLDTGKSHWSDELYRIFGLEPGSVQPSLELFLSMVHTDDREKVATLARESLEKQEPFSSYYCRIVRPDGSIRILLGQGKVLLDEAGAPAMMIGTALDVTEREAMAEEIQKLNSALEARAVELEAANRELEAFSYTVCHDLRSPLTNIHGYAQVLVELCSEQLDEQCRRYLQEISRGTERMNTLIETLLHFSIITSRSLNLDRVNLSEVFRQAALELHLEDPKRQIDFIIEENVHVKGDEGLLRVVAMNLLGNAWKYTGSRERALIEFGMAERQGKSACFVRDNGIGFDTAEAKKLFAPFHRLHETTDIKGHGIGLATVKRIVERHGGSVWAEGEPDQGACFYFTLPPP